MANPNDRENQSQKPNQATPGQRDDAGKGGQHSQTGGGQGQQGAQKGNPPGQQQGGQDPQRQDKDKNPTQR